MGPTRQAPLPLNAVHVWRFSLISSRQEIAVLSRWLDVCEQAAIARMVSRAGRDRRIIAWGRLKYVLSRYLRCPPGSIEIGRESGGRPEIEHPRTAGLRFSLAHSGSLGLLGVSHGAVGIDIEKVDAGIDVERLATRFFSPNEAGELRSVPEADRFPRFFRLWVLKEAYLKAMGEGVPAGLSKCEFALDADGPRLFRSEFEPRESRQSLFEIPVSAGYAAALAVSERDADVSVFDL